MLRNLEKLFVILFVFLCFSCEKTIDNNKVSFCSLIETPQKYQAKIIQTKAITLGYHTFIFYSHKCLEQEKVIALEMSNKARQKISEAILAKRFDYKTDFLNSNLYAEITVLGELKENDENKQSELFHPKYKFIVKEIKEVNILKEEIYPTPEARGVKEIKIK
jgi:hypothetical protein